MQFFLLLLTYALIKYRISKINANSEACFNNFEDFELTIRNFLKTGELNEELILKMNKNFKIDKNPLNRVVLAYYCNDLLQNFMLAYNEVIRVNYSGFNIFINFLFRKKQFLKKAK